MDEKAKKALRWITEILLELNIPFQIGGGLAAIFYGVDRPLADIDIALMTKDLPKLYEKVKNYITYDLREYNDKEWNVTGMTIEYCGQEIDFVGAQGKKIFDDASGAWLKLENDFSRSVYFKIEDLEIPVVPRDYLVSYKKILARDVDIEDLKGLGEIV